MKRRERLSRSILVLMFAGAGAASAQTAPTDVAYGLGGQDHWVSATRFVPHNSTQGVLSHQGAHYWKANIGSTWEAQFQLPNGVRILSLQCYYHRTAGQTNPMQVLMNRNFYDETTQTPSTDTVAMVTSAAITGYGIAELHNINHTFLSRSGPNVNELNIYSLQAYLPDDNIALRGCRIFYQRQIAPAPITARFTDVPPGAQFFAEVEALADSGITLGCTATTFCPEQALTRRQMAAFLARALGLHWPAF